MAFRAFCRKRPFLFFHLSGDPIVWIAMSPAGEAKSWQGQLSILTFTFHFHALEKEMATHSSVLAWKIPGTGSWWAAVYGVTQSWTQLK